MSYADAGSTIQSIDEIQLVVGAILDHGWESRSAGTQANDPGTLYAPSIPILSVGPVGSWKSPSLTTIRSPSAEYSGTGDV